MTIRHRFLSLLLTAMMLLAAGSSGWTYPSSLARADDSPPEPLPFECGGVTPPTCCIYGYVYHDGAPVNGASVLLQSAHGFLTTATAAGPFSSHPYYSADLSAAPLLAAAGDSITITASYNGIASARTWLTQPNGQQVDLELVLGATTRVSVASDGTQGNNSSDYTPALSADGRYVAFYSIASNLVSGDTNDVSDVFVHDRQTGQTARVSVASDGAQGNGHSYGPSLSADGRYVAFGSYASNLVSGDTNEVADIFVHDRQTGQTTRVSVASDGTQGNGRSINSSISADGRYVAFASEASNLVNGDSNGQSDIFVHDRQLGQTTRISVASNGAQGNSYSDSPSLSADGRYVAFWSLASNLVSGDTNGWYDIFVRDRQTGQTTRVSVASDGTQGNNNAYDASLSADGRYVAFRSEASNLVSGDTNGCYDVFVHDRQTGQTTRVSVASDGTQGNGRSYGPSLSADGRYVAFWSVANNLVSGDTNSWHDVFVHDRQTGQTIRDSVASDGTQGNRESIQPALSADGRYVAFWSYASNLVSGDTNEVADIFVHDRGGTPPAAAFTAAPLAGTAPLTVTFTDLSTGTIIAWTWSFGDGGVSSARHPAHVYEMAGSYTVTLTVAGPGGSDTETKPGYITVNPTGVPVAGINYIWPNPATQGRDMIYFNGSGYDTDEDGAYITAYLWTSSRDGPLSVQEDFTIQAAELSVGAHTITFQCQDNEGVWSLPVTRTLTVQAGQPDVRTLILVNKQKLAALYSSPEADQVLTKLNALAAHPNVKGLVVPVENDPAVAAAYAARGSDYSNKNKANAVVEAIKQVILAQWSAHPDLEYLVLVGDDRALPFYRTADGTWYPDTWTLTDDFYADSAPTPCPGCANPYLYIPDLASGRLVETPAQIIGQVDTFLAGPSLNLDNAAVTGYDFIRDGAQAHCNTLQSDSLSADCTLIGNSWTRSDFISRVLQTHHDVTSINGHANEYGFGTPSGEFIGVSDFTGTTVDFARAIFYTVGCHSGYNVPDGLDLPEGLAIKKANYVANTGYGWGGGGVVLSEELMWNFTKKLVFGAQTTPGRALMLAKQQYFADHPSPGPYDEKISTESTLYGLPMYQVTSPAGLSKEMSGESIRVQSRPVALKGDLTQESVAYSWPMPAPQTTPAGTYYTLFGAVVGQGGEPILPRLSVDVSRPDRTLHGVVFTGGSYSTVSTDPIVQRVITTGVEFAPSAQGFTAPGWYPATFFAPNRVETGAGSKETLVATAGQYNPNLSSDRQRIYTGMNFDVYYHTSSSDWTAPAITSMSSSLGAGAATVTVGASDPSGVHAVVIAYTDGAGVWASASLTWNGQVWTGSFPASTATQFFVQAVDGAGNVAVDDHGGAYYQPGDHLEHRLFLPLVLRNAG